MDSDLKILLQEKESKELDYKGPCDWNQLDKKEKCELVKDILSMANTKGGWLVIGVEETVNGFNRVGLRQEQAASFDTTKVNQFLNNYADPPINTSLKKIEYEGKLFVIIGVPLFEDTPHICQKEYPDVLSTPTIYVRTDNNESAPLKSSSDFRDIVETTVRNRSDLLLTSFRTILKHGPAEQKPSAEEQIQKQLKETTTHCENLNPHASKGYGYIETIFYPSIFGKERFDFHRLRSIVERASISYTGWPFIFIARERQELTYNLEDGIETFLSDPDPFHGGVELHFWRLYQSGLLYMKELLQEDSHLSQKGQDTFVDFVRLSQYAGKAIDCLVRLYDSELDEQEEVTLSFRLIGIKDRPLGSLDQRRFLSSCYISRLDSIHYLTKHPLVEWKAGLIDHALEICNYVFLRFNWNYPNIAESRKIIEEMFKRRFR
jgi:hypothetical protein